MKNKLKSLVVGFVAAVLGCVAFIGTGVSYEKNSFAASPVSVCSNAGDVQSQEFVISSVTGGSKTFYLYKNSDTSTNSAKALFSYYYGNAAVKGNDSSDTELLHNVGNGVVSKTVEGNGQFVSTINLSNNIIIAMNNGYITNVSASAAAHSLYSDNWAAADEPETITMSLYVYDSNSDVYVQANDVSCKTTDISQGGLSSSVSGFDSKSLNTIALSFRSKFTIAKNSWGIPSTTGKNYMKVQNPTLTLSSTDTTIPTISAVPTKTTWSKTNEINLSFADAESGIFKVEVSKDGGSTWEVVAGTNYAENLEYRTSGTTAYPANENGTYLFKVTDNVGNEKLSDAVVISNIDTNETTAEVSLEDVYTSKIFNFASVVNTEGNSPDYLYYTYELNGSVSEPIAYASGTNTISVSENGTYKFTFYAYDEATYNDGGVAVSVYEKEIIVDDTVYSVNITYQNATGTESFTTLRTSSTSISFEADSNNSYFYQLWVNGEIIPENNIVDGLYTFEVVQNLEISVLFRQQITLDFVTEYTYSKNGFTPEFSANIDDNYAVNLTYVDESTSKTIAGINGVGTYTISYKISDNFYFGEGSITGVVVNPKPVELSNIQTNYEYLATVQELKFTASEDLEFIVTFVRDEQIVEFLYAGEYNFTVALADNEINKNYTLSVSGTAKINPFEVQITETQNTFVYDKTNKKLIYTTNVSDESFVVVETYKKGTDVVLECVNHGEYTVLLTTENTNYVLSYSSKITVNKRDIEVKAVSQVLTYGETVKTLDYETTNTLDAEPLTFDLVSNYQPVYGNYVISIVQATSQTDAEKELFANYNITFTSGTITVNKKLVYVIPDEKQTKVYGEADENITYRVSGLLDGDTLSGSLSRVQGENVGYYDITIGSLSNGNYEMVLVPASYQIIRRIVFVTLENKTKTYGDVDPTLTIKLAGSNILTNELHLFENNISREAGEDVGTYAISISKTGLDNYVVVFLEGQLVIERKLIVVTAEEKSVVYGETTDLTYRVSGLCDGDTLSGSLSREAGEDVGTYAICVGTLASNNYQIDFVSANYNITPKTIYLYAIAGSKIYGENDTLTYVLDGAYEELDIVLSRESGENVGVYEINSYVCETANYTIEFISATYEILPKAVSVQVESATKTYLDLDPEFSAIVEGAEFDDAFDFEFERIAGENVGSYEISIINLDSYKNYSFTQTKADLEIQKKDIFFKLNDKTVIYSGNAYYIDYADCEFELTYKYTYFGTEVTDPTNAGEYKVKALFAGNENYNAFESNEATLSISKKFIPVTIKNATFTYNGKEKSPTFDINLDEEVSVIIKYENNVVPIEVGEYNFSVISNDPNYYSNFTSTLKIVNEFYSEDASGTASVSSSSVSLSGLGVQIYEDKNSSLMSMFTPLKNNRTTISVFGFTNISNAVADENGVFTIKIYAPEANEDVKIYTVDENGKPVAISYTYSDGAYVISLNSLATKIIITEADMTAYYAKIIISAVVIVGSIVGFAISRKNKKIKFMKKNTTISKFDKETAKHNKSVVVSKINFEEYLSAEEFTKAKKWG